MNERDPIYDHMKDHSKEKFAQDRARFLDQAISSNDGGWMHHTLYHWSRYVAGERLDYWPSRKKYQYKGKVMRGDVQAFIAKLERGNNG